MEEDTYIEENPQREAKEESHNREEEVILKNRRELPHERGCPYGECDESAYERQKERQRWVLVQLI